MDNALLAVIVGAVAGILGTYVGTVFKFRKDLELEYDKDLRAQRIAEYRKLWKLTEAFPKYERPQAFTMTDLQRLQADLQRWYFQEGGLFLSDLSATVYFSLKEALQEAINTGTPEAALDPQTDRALYLKVRALSAALARDISTRKQLELN